MGAGSCYYVVHDSRNYYCNDHLVTAEADRCNSRCVVAAGVVHSCTLVLAVDVGMSWVVEGPSEKDLTLEAVEPSLALGVEVGRRDSYPVRLAVRIQDLCGRRMDWVLALSSLCDYLGHDHCDPLVREHHREIDLSD